jgi:cysteine synthase A
MPLISENKIIGPHKIEGIGDDFVPSLVDRDIIDDIILVNDDDAVNMSRLLSKYLGLGVGISSGANFIASVLTKDKMDENVVTVFADDSKKYLSTDLMKDIDTNKEFISNKIELIEIKKAD